MQLTTHLSLSYKDTFQVWNLGTAAKDEQTKEFHAKVLHTTFAFLFSEEYNLCPVRISSRFIFAHKFYLLFLSRLAFST